MSMRLLTLMTAFVALSVLPASAVDFNDPRSVVEAAYQPYLSADFDWSDYDGSLYRSAGLNALYQRDIDESEDDIGRLDFDPLINGQDYEITKFAIGPATETGDSATVAVTFENFETPETMRVELVREGGAFKIDNLISESAEYPYDLREILQAPRPEY